MRFDVLTIFPDIVYQYASESILKRAQKAGLVEIGTHNFRDFTNDKQCHVDDRPYGGGAGMILQVQPIYDTLKSIGIINNGQKIKKLGTKIIIMDPAGKKFDQKMAQRFSKLKQLIIVCGRYEGFDERVYKFIDEKISVGDYVLSGGELPALSIIEATSRLIPGVLGNEDSIKCETFSKTNKIITETNKKKEEKKYILLGGKYPQYTRPENFLGMKVPKILLTGDHQKIKNWREKKLKIK